MNSKRITGISSLHEATGLLAIPDHTNIGSAFVEFLLSSKFVERPQTFTHSTEMNMWTHSI